jgi:hypothetical protein
VIPGWRPWQIFAKQTDIGQSRTSALNPLQWALVILPLGAAVLKLSGAPDWLVAGLGVAALLVVVLFGIAYLYFMLNNVDALRSEAYSLHKIALEKGLVGDSLHGTKTIDSTNTGLVVTRDTNQEPVQEQQGS